MPEPLLTPEQVAALIAEPIESSSDGQSAKARSAKDLAQLLTLVTAVATPRRSPWRSFSVGVPPGANGRP